VNPYQSLRQDLANQDWRLDALCAQVSMAEFHADKGEGGMEAINFAKKICGLCDVKSECLQFAIQVGDSFGIWGGLPPRERSKLGKRLGIRRSAPVEDWHGSEAGAKRHYRAGTKVCPDCRRGEQRAKDRRQSA
jgi:hypothetical protein